MKGSTVRVNPVTGRTVVLAPSRADRPRDPDPVATASSSTSFDPSCPFCPGNEDALPEIVAEWDAGAKEGGWAVRAAPNRYPAFRPPPAGSGPGRSVEPREAAPGGTGPGRSTERPAVGEQEVIVESPRHDEDLATMTVHEVIRVVAAWRDRYRRLLERPWVEHVLLFRNRGRAAGASLEHPHTQIVALDRVPPDVRRRQERLRAHHRAHRACLLCTSPAGAPAAAISSPLSALETARNGSTRVVVPWAPETRYETWVVPSRHVADFGETRDDELEDVAAALHRACRSLWAVQGRVDYNVLLHTGGKGTDARAEHWFLQLRPRHGQIAGFELASGLRIGDADPPSDARRLRNALDAGMR